MTHMRTTRRRPAQYLTAAGLAAIIGLSTMAALPNAAAAPAAPTTEQTCTLAPPASAKSEAPTSCVAAEVALDRIPALGETATATVTIRSEVAIDRAKVTLRAPEGLSFASEGFSAAVQRGLDAESTRVMALPQGSTTLSVTVKADETGRAQLQVDAVDADRPEADRSAHATTELTVGKTAATTFEGVKGRRSEAHSKDGSVQQDATADRTPARTSGKVQATAGASDVCAIGSLNYADYYGTWKPGRQVKVEVVGQTAVNGPVTTLASGLTSATGAYNFCFQPTTLNTATMWVKLTTSNDWWEVTEMTGASPYVVETAQKLNVRRGSVQDFGLTTPDALHMRAFHAFDVINKVYDVRGSGTDCWTYQESADCGKLKARWAPGNTNGGYYQTAAAVRAVFLTDAMPDAPTTVVHEAGHNLQHLLYDWYWPKTNCPSPHFLDKSSSQACGWTEGFPNGLVAYLFEDGRYYYNVNAWMDLRQSGFSDPSLPASRTNPDNGADCECRVAGALYGLWTKIDGGPQKTLDNMDRYASESFEEWFNVDRPKTGLNVSAKARNQLFKYTIDLRKVNRTENVTNPGLEDQGEGWEWTNGVVGTYSHYPAHGGNFYAWMGGNGVESTDTLFQDVTVPETGTTLLDFWLRVNSAEPTTTAADSFEAQVTDEAGETSIVYFRTNVDKTTVYSQRVVDLSDWAGQTVTLKFVSTEDAGEQTDFLVDDVSVYTTR
ncbi:hypothetical protein GCM10009809_22870 [Isoptericola hypogeus]|uniref:Gametolysin peptidase M11 n=1 Tax=Isoptericola hypogeus TaxID=300179 RepID=A0ABN2JGQ4_9MICO